MTRAVFCIIAVAVPVIVSLLEWLRSGDMSERHHSHHDTFVIGASLSRSLVAAMIFMGVTGLVFGWLCEIDVFEADTAVVLGFFDGFLVVALVIWFVMRRYRVALYRDHMIVTPFVGPPVAVRYEDISSMEWTGYRSGSGYRNLTVFVDGERATTLWGGLDLEQILMRIDRFDVLGHASNS